MDKEPKDNRVGKFKTIKILIVVLIALVILGVGFTAAFKMRHFKKTSNFESMGFNRDFKMRGIRGAVKGGEKFNIGRITGDITKIDGSNLTVKQDNVDISVAISDSTSIYKQSTIGSVSDLSVGLKITINGRPNSSGVVQANLILIK